MHEHDLLFWTPTDGLYHHGIRGQKWGQRNGPPYPLDSKEHSAAEKKAAKGATGSEDVTVKKGTRVGHVTNEQTLNLKSSPIGLYDTQNESDAKTYEGEHALNIWNYVDTPYKHEYETTEDLVSPSAKERVNLFAKTYSEHKQEFSSYLNELQDFLKKQKDRNNLNAKMTDLINENSDYSFSANKDLGSDSEKNYAYALYNYDRFYYPSGRNDNSTYATQSYIDTIKSKGYNAIVDDADLSYYTEASQPIIALNANKSLKEISVSTVSNFEEMLDELYG